MNSADGTNTHKWKLWVVVRPKWHQISAISDFCCALAYSLCTSLYVCCPHAANAFDLGSATSFDFQSFQMLNKLTNWREFRINVTSIFIAKIIMRIDGWMKRPGLHQTLAHMATWTRCTYSSKSLNTYRGAADTRHTMGTERSKCWFIIINNIAFVFYFSLSLRSAQNARCSGVLHIIDEW